MGYAFVAALGLALAACAWLVWRRRRPLTALRAIAVTLILASTAVGLWLLHDLDGVTRGAEGAADAFSRAASFH